MSEINDSDRTNPTGLLTSARDYHVASLIVFHNREKLHYEITYLFLISQAIELSLKSFIRYKEATLDDLKQKFGHDLKKCLEHAKKCGLDITIEEDEDKSFYYLSGNYSGKNFNYVKTGLITAPFSFEKIFKLSRSLSDKLLTYVGEKIDYPKHHLRYSCHADKKA